MKQVTVLLTLEIDDKQIIDSPVPEKMVLKDWLASTALILLMDAVGLEQEAEAAKQ